MAVAVQLFPVTGQPLPLISSGGTSIWMTCLAIGIIQSVRIGSGEVWSGSDLSIVKYDKGKMVLSTLKLVENLNYDPVSEIVLLNIINYFR